MADNIEQSIAQHIATQILPGSVVENILESGSLFDDGIVDSLALQQLLVHLETEFSIDVDEDDLIPENFETIRGMAALVERLQKT